MSWKERIKEAKERGSFISRDRLNAGSWSSCAMAERHPGFADKAREMGLFPDNVLTQRGEQLGNHFSKYVMNNFIGDAEQCYKSIMKGRWIRREFEKSSIKVK